MKEKKIPHIDTADGEVVSLDEAQSKGMMGFMNIDPKNLKKFSHVDSEEDVRRLAVMDMASKRFGDLPIIDDFIENYLELKISFTRKGRTEWVEILASTMKQKLQESMGGVMGRLRGAMG